MGDIDFRDTSDPDVRMFWFRRRMVVIGAIAAASTLGIFAYVPLSDTAGVSQSVTWYEWLIIIIAAIGGFGAFLYALPWRFPGSQWSYLLLGADATFCFVLFQVSVPFSVTARALITSTLILIMVVAYSAHSLDGGQRSNENSLLFGPPP